MDLPDEDSFELTAEQLAAAVPRRGRPSARAFEMRPDDTERWRYNGIEQRREDLRQAAASPATDPRIAAALMSYINGRPDAVGAAAAFLVDDAVGTPLWADPRYSQYDAWLGEHGPEFAAAAVMEYYTLKTVDPVLRGVPVRDPADRPYAVETVPPDPDESPWRNLGLELARLRTHLSRMPEPMYRRIEAILESKDRNPVQRAARAFLMPERTDWVEGVCEERPRRRFADFAIDNWLFQCVSSMDQLERARLTRLQAVAQFPHVVWTLVEGVGPDCAPLLAHAAARHDTKPDRRAFLFEALGALPSDTAVRFFLERHSAPGAWDLALKAARRFPIRTLRMIAELATVNGDADRVSRAGLVGVLQSEPLLRGPARDALDPADRDRIDALAQWRDLPPETTDVPAALATPPQPDGRRKAPAAPPWAAMITPVPLLLKGRRARLPQAAAAHLLAAMALDTPKHPHPAVQAAIAHCDTVCLREFSWAVFATWDRTGDRANPWALTQLARFADDDIVRRLEAVIREWPGQGLHKRAVRGLELLGAIGTEEALGVVHRIAKQVAFKGLKKAALAEVDKIAARLGLDQEQLLDRLVPDFELDADGRMTLDYGPRAFTVGFDEQLKPFVIDPKGKVRKSLPKPDGEDDPEAATLAGLRFDKLKRGLRSVGTDQVKRLEKAMTSGRVWSRADFERHVAGHALMRHLARRLVWQYTTGRGWTSFRVAEDGTYADLRDDAIRLPERSAVRLPHPLHLGSEIKAWAEVFADYEVVQPFEQLARAVFALTDEEAATGRIARLEGRSVHTGPLVGLQRGRTWWKYTYAFANTHAPYGLCREIPDVGFLMLDLQPGIDPAAPTAEPHQRLNSVRFSTVEAADGPAPRDLDPLLVSELLAVLDRHIVR
ncbi:DUF4132 domain-containing protein [Glycomyces albidus]|uniref:DUF4132 domain-containing protein n=1 Tax=Glycomyces albidus TaxID=2656774 RepID=A0A6L5GG37_9ACTN|nr:DUF4132 domain-containing protein [Glycomyces albidus]MQM28640.1 DUF4132 domain-containing protein [Glycomyces albidus]